MLGQLFLSSSLLLERQPSREEKDPSPRPGSPNNYLLAPQHLPGFSGPLFFTPLKGDSILSYIFIYSINVYWVPSLLSLWKFPLPVTFFLKATLSDISIANQFFYDYCWHNISFSTLFFQHLCWTNVCLLYTAYCWIFFFKSHLTISAFWLDWWGLLLNTGDTMI